MLSVPPSHAGSREKPTSIASSIAASMVCVDLDRDHVGARQHHFAHDGVAELEDRVDELALLAFDGLLFGGDVGHRADLLLGDERALLQPLPGEHDVGDADEATRQDAQRGEVREEPEQRRDPQRGASVFWIA